MARKDRLAKLIDDTMLILSAVGVPLDGLTLRRRVKMSKAFLAVAGMKPGMMWAEAQSDHRLRSRDVIRWMNEHLGEEVSPGSYDDIRRKDLLLPIESGLVLKSAGNQRAATNDGTRTYALTPETGELLHRFGTNEWAVSVAEFMSTRTNLSEELKKLRFRLLVPITIGSTELHFGPGEHNKLQKTIIESFLPRFGHGAEVLYVGDTEDKLLYVEEARLLALGFFELSRDKLPDVLAYSKDKNYRVAKAGFRTADSGTLGSDRLHLGVLDPFSIPQVRSRNCMGD